MNERTNRMGTIESCIHVIAPMVSFTVSDRCPNRFTVVNIFALSIFDFSDFALFIKPFHFHYRRHIAIILSVSIYLTAFFHCFYQFHSFFHRLARKHLAEHMQTTFQALNGKRCVFSCIICQNHGVHIVIDKIIEIFVIRYILCPVSSFLSFQNFAIFVTYSNYFRLIFRRNAVIYHTRSSVCAQHSNLYHNKILL